MALILRSPAGLGSKFPAEVGVIDYHRALQDQSRLTFVHHLHEFVLNSPDGGVAGAELAFQLQRRDAVLRLTDQEHRMKTRTQRELRFIEDCPRAQARLLSSAAALPTAGILNIKLAMVGSAALRAVEAFWPACLR